MKTNLVSIKIDLFMRKLVHFINISQAANNCRSLPPTSNKEIHSSSITTSFRSLKGKMLWSTYYYTIVHVGHQLDDGCLQQSQLLCGILISLLLEYAAYVRDDCFFSNEHCGHETKMICLGMLAVNNFWVSLALWTHARSYWDTLSLPLATPSIQVQAMDIMDSWHRYR